MFQPMKISFVVNYEQQEHIIQNHNKKVEMKGRSRKERTSDFVCLFVNSVTESNSNSQVDWLKRTICCAGIHELHLPMEDYEMTIVDVGGQRSERRKWLHCFENVTAVLYFVALDECMFSFQKSSLIFDL